MTIGEQTIKWYEQNQPQGSFAATLLRCFLYGVIVKRPDFVLLAEEVLSDGKVIVAMGPHCPKNCWWLHFVTWPDGQIAPHELVTEAPYSLPYVAFKRRGKIRIYSWDHLTKEYLWEEHPQSKHQNRLTLE